MYADADFANCKETRKSTTGYVCLYNGSPIAWRSQKQKCVSTSTTEAEIIAASSAVKTLIWLKTLFENIKKDLPVPVLMMDNASAEKWVKLTKFRDRTKHIDVQYRFVRQVYSDGVMEIKHVSSEQQLADGLTKVLAKPRFVELRQRIGIKTEGGSVKGSI